MSVASFIGRADEIERRYCMLANSVCARRAIRQAFRIVSRLGDGVFWYVLIASMPLWFGAGRYSEGLRVSAQMLLSGGLGLVLYKFLKKTLVRERPFIGSSQIECIILPLDRYSFPSGHTLHAVLFTTIVVRAFPQLALVLVPFSILIAASRVVLGLHYPSDVLAGALIGWTISRLVELLFFV